MKYINLICIIIILYSILKDVVYSILIVNAELKRVAEKYPASKNLKSFKQDKINIIIKKIFNTIIGMLIFWGAGLFNSLILFIKDFLGK